MRGKGKNAKDGEGGKGKISKGLGERSKTEMKSE